MNKEYITVLPGHLVIEDVLLAYDNFLDLLPIKAKKKKNPHYFLS